MKTIAEYDAEIQRSPNDPKLYDERGSAYAEKAIDDKAIADFNKAIQLDPNYIRSYYNRGIAYFNVGATDLAIADFNKAIQLDPNNAELYYMRGYIFLHRKKDFERAIADFTQAIQINPDYALAYRRRAEASYQGKEDYNQAIADYDQAIRLDPNDAETYFYRGLRHIDREDAKKDKGDYTKAIADFDHAIKINPNYAEAYFYRGLQYTRNPDSCNQSISDLEQALRLGLDNFQMSDLAKKSIETTRRMMQAKKNIIELSTGVDQNLFGKLRKLIAETLDVNEGDITMETSFKAFGADKHELITFELDYASEKEFGVFISVEKANEFKTVRDLYEFIKAQQ